MSVRRLPLDVVTGGAGFIGSHLAERLLESGRRVRIVDDLSSGSRRNIPEGAEFLEGGVASLAGEAVLGADVVYHLAAIPSVPYSFEFPVESLRANVESTLALLSASERAGVRRVVFASSSAVYGDEPGLPRRESQPPRPLSPYAVGKLSGEYYLQLWAGRGALETVSLRFFNVFGPRQDPRSPYAAVIPLFLERMLAGQALGIFGDGRQTRDFIHVSDVARCLVAAGSARGVSGQVFNIASGRAISLLDLISAIGDLSGREPRVLHLPRRPGDIEHSWADVSAARQALDFAASISLEEGLRLTQAWFDERRAAASTAGS